MLTQEFQKARLVPDLDTEFLRLGKLGARLAAGDATVMEIAAPFDVSKQAVSKHLRVLEDAGLVSRKGEEYRKPVHLEAEVFDLMTKWIERYRRQAEERYQRLDRVLADMDRTETKSRPRRDRAS